MQRIMPWVVLGVMTMAPQAAPDLTGEVKTVGGTPMLFVNGKPTPPLVFYATAGPQRLNVTTEWQKFEGSFVAPEDMDHAGLHIHFGITPKVLWIDGVRFHEGEPDSDAQNHARGGDFEGTLEDFEQDWTLFTREDLGAKATAAIDETTAAGGDKSLKVDVQAGGSETWHAHIFQTPHELVAGRTYTYSGWLKADRATEVHMSVVEHGGDWTQYASVGDTPFERQFSRAAKAGVHIHSFTVPMGRYREGQKPDFAATDIAVERVLGADPEALIIPRMGMDGGGWWDRTEEDMMLYDDGSRGMYSVASEKWRRGASECLRATVRHLEAKYGDHMLGYHPCGQNSGEWFYNRSWDYPMSCYEEPVSIGFRKWVREKYDGQIETVRRAWRERLESFDDIVVPSERERRRTRLGAFRDPVRERKLVDFFEYIQVAMVEPLETFARIIKEETRERKLVVYFYGYLFDMCGPPNGSQSTGHLALGRLLGCPDVDVLCSPISYFDRHLGGSGPFMTPVESVQAHGKLWLNEDDTRTYLTAPEANFGRVDTPQHTFWVHQRNFAQFFTRRMACWWMDLGGTGWLDADDIWENLGRLSAYYAADLTPRVCTPEIAVIIDEKSCFYQSCSRDVTYPLVYEMRHSLYRMGAPFGQYLLSDLVAGRVPPAKLHIFLDCFALTDEERDAVGVIVRRSGTTAVWFYGAGFIGEDASVENMSRLTGFLFDQEDERQTRVGLIADDSDLLRNVPNEFDAGPVPAPVFSPREDQPSTVVLARFDPSGAPAIAVRRNEWTSVYVGSLRCPAQLLRNIAMQAGVHIYLDSDDVLVTDGRFLAIQASEAGPKTIRLPGQATIRDALSGAVVAEHTDSITLELDLGETRLYEIGD